MIQPRFLKSKIHAADVGAFGGIPEYWKPFSDKMLIEAFEPDKEECKKQSNLKSKNINWHPIGLAEETKLIPLYVLNRHTGSSLFPPNEGILNRFNLDTYSGLNKIINIPCHSLSDFIAEKRLSSFHLIKIDSQGSELRILNGLKEKDRVDLCAIELEVSFIPLYKNIPLFADIDQYLQKIGFEIWDLRTHRAYQIDNKNGKKYIDKILNFKSGNKFISPQLIQGDALYFKKIDLIKKNDFPYILIISCIYKAFDKFQSILEHGKSNLWINETEYQEWIEFAKQNFDKPKISQKFKFLVDKLINKIFKFDPNDKRIFWTKRVFPDQ